MHLRGRDAKLGGRRAQYAIHKLSERFACPVKQQSEVVGCYEREHLGSSRQSSAATVPVLVRGHTRGHRNHRNPRFESLFFLLLWLFRFTFNHPRKYTEHRVRRRRTAARGKSGSWSTCLPSHRLCSLQSRLVVVTHAKCGSDFRKQFATTRCRKSSQRWCLCCSLDGGHIVYPR